VYINFSDFEVDEFRKAFQRASEELVLSLEAGNDAVDQNGLQMLAAMKQSIDIMQRVDADRRHKSGEPLGAGEISQIGDYALSLLDELSVIAANRGLQTSMLALQRLSIPVAQWIAGHGGDISSLDIVVNAFASYANEIRQEDKLKQLSDSIARVIQAVSDDIRRDLEAANPMRPWRILNLNWGIVATRSHHVETMQQVFDQLIENIPADAKNFFREGMQQMDIIGYPEHVREVMDKYNRLVGNAESLH
jgi:hypothetical protein